MTTTATFAPAGTWSLDPVHSSVGFEVPYLAGTFKGTFRDAAATLEVADDKATLEGIAKVASIDVKDENLAAHLQTPDFFDAEQFPELRFRAQEISVDGDTVVVDGELTIKGVTRPATVTGTVTAPLVDAYGNDRIGLVVSAQIDRTEFGVSWNNPLPSGEPSLANDVTIVGDLQFVRSA
jgi:polyisoprenoid-binding protein YceI